MRVESLRVHPVKSTAIRRLDRARVTRAGLTGDREWMVVDAHGDLVSARDLPALFTLTADTRATAALPDGVDLRIRAIGHDDLLVRTPDTPAQEVRMFGKAPLRVKPADPAADAWLHEALGRADLHLVWCHDPPARRLNPAHSEPTDHAALQDGYPVTILSTASVDQLRAWVQESDERPGAVESVTVDRFRPNIVVSGADAFAEDTWARVRVGPVLLRRAKPVDRCVMTTIDPVTLVKHNAGLRALARHRRHEGAVILAVNLIPDLADREQPSIHVGDPVVPLD